MYNRRFPKEVAPGMTQTGNNSKTKKKVTIYKLSKSELAKLYPQGHQNHEDVSKLKKPPTPDLDEVFGIFTPYSEADRKLGTLTNKSDSIQISEFIPPITVEKVGFKRFAVDNYLAIKQ